MIDQRPLVGLGVIIKQDNKVLLLKRKGSHGNGTWAFIGGHLEFGETLEQCAARETKEEVGISIKNIKPMAFTNDILKEDEKHYVTLFVTAEPGEGRVRNMEPEKSSEVKWIEWDNFPKPLFLPVENLREQGFSPFS